MLILRRSCNQGSNEIVIGNKTVTVASIDFDNKNVTLQIDEDMIEIGKYHSANPVVLNQAINVSLVTMRNDYIYLAIGGLEVDIVKRSEESSKGIA